MGPWKRATDVRTLIAGIVCVVVIVVIELAVQIVRRFIVVGGETAPIKIVRSVTMAMNTVVSSIVENVKMSIAMVAALSMLRRTGRMNVAVAVWVM